MYGVATISRLIIGLFCRNYRSLLQNVDAERRASDMHENSSWTNFVFTHIYILIKINIRIYIYIAKKIHTYIYIIIRGNSSWTDFSLYVYTYMYINTYIRICILIFTYIYIITYVCDARLSASTKDEMYFVHENSSQTEIFYTYIYM